MTHLWLHTTKSLVLVFPFTQSKHKELLLLRTVTQSVMQHTCSGSPVFMTNYISVHVFLRSPRTQMLTAFFVLTFQTAMTCHHLTPNTGNCTHHSTFNNIKNKATCWSAQVHTQKTRCQGAITDLKPALGLCPWSNTRCYGQQRNSGWELNSQAGKESQIQCFNH